MDKGTRLRRVALLSCHFVRNYAYYNGGSNGETTKAIGEFWTTVQGNFLDIAVLEWTKLFGSYADEHHWKKVVTDSNQFKTNMLTSCRLTDKGFSNVHKKIKVYRDHFLAHLDKDEKMHIPHLGYAQKLIYYYYGVVYNMLEKNRRQDLPVDIEMYYEECLLESKYYFDTLKPLHKKNDNI